MEDVAAALPDGEADAMPSEEVAVVGNAVAEADAAEGVRVVVDPPEHAVTSNPQTMTANTSHPRRRVLLLVIGRS
jgi:hypothetical protein